MSLILWDELIPAWRVGDFSYAHDWLNERWAHAVQSTPEGETEAFAAFLQGLAFAALAFHFAAEDNAESAGLFVSDGLERLPRYRPAYAGIEVAPLLDALAELREQLASTQAGQPLTLPPVVRQALRFEAGRRA